MTENTIFAPKSLNFGPGGALYAGLLLEGTYKLSSGATATSNNQDVFIVKYDSSLAIKAHTLYGGSGYDDFGAVEVSPSGDVWVVLNTDAADVGSLVPSTNSRFAPVIAKFNAGLTTKKNETLIKQATGNDVGWKKGSRLKVEIQS